MATVDVATIRHKLKCASSVAIILQKLLEQERVTPEEVDMVLANPRKAMWRIRKDLEPHDIEIKSWRNQGYWIDADDKPRIIELLGGTHGAVPAPHN